MSTPVITVEHLSKSYILKHQNAERYTALRDVLTNKAKAIVSSKSQIINSKSEVFWALKDVSFEINEGDRVGIIGRNGAGKSTLLKILSRIVSPTKGKITIEGRVASLLEVGTGFHAELSGRENIFLNGSILGMSKAEIKSKFDEIVAFSEIEKFLDTPVKRYSSGMYVRLAFAVAAHLDPEILIVDEVLAVGDAEFQRKCLGKMKEVSGEGRTVLFVSHNMGAISALCSKSIILNKGRIEFDGSVDKALKAYHNIQNSNPNKIYRSEGVNKEVFISEAFLKNSENENITIYAHDEPVFLVIKFNANVFLEDLFLSISVWDSQDRKVFTSEILISKVLKEGKQYGEGIMKIPAIFLTENDYKINAGIHIPNLQVFDFVENICSFSIVDNGSPYAKYKGTDVGLVYSKCEWNVI